MNTIPKPPRVNEWLTKVPPLLKIGFGALLTLWGAIAADPNYVSYPPKSVIFDLLTIVPEDILGIIVAVLGLLILLATIFTWTKTLIFSAGASFLLWLFISVGYFVNQWHAFGGVVYLAFALLCAYIYISESVVTKRERRLAKNKENN